MPYFPTLTTKSKSEEIIRTFGGYNHNPEIGEGEWYDEQNMTSDGYPMLTVRGKRGEVRTITSPGGLIGKDCLVWVDGTSVYKNGLDITAAIGGPLTTGAKTLVSMGAYIVIFPDKRYFNTEDTSDHGTLENNPETKTDVSVQMCEADGTVYSDVTTSPTEPDNPTNGMHWLDTSQTKHSLKTYANGTWTAVGTVYCKLSATGIGAGFAEYDGVSISGLEGSSQLTDLNGSKILYAVGADYVVITGLLDAAVSSKTVTISRTVPQMDFVIEAQNRLWGCKYGMVDGKTVNEIYCSALGDFKNWNQFLGVSTDSWVGSVGTDGQFTGAVNHLGYPIFFKETCLHKVYISSAGAHQVVSTDCKGVQKGSGKSLAVVGSMLFYKSNDCVCAYDGSLPYSVSDALGDTRYQAAVSGVKGDKLYISMKDAANAWHLFTYDKSRKLWHREDSTQILCFACKDGELYAINSGGKLLSMTGQEGTAESAVTWRAESGLMGYSVTQKKYVSRLNIRMILPSGSTCKIEMQYDDGRWINCGQKRGTGTATFLWPIRPRRCDHFRIRLSGTGACQIYSISKIIEKGGDGR